MSSTATAFYDATLYESRTLPLLDARRLGRVACAAGKTAIIAAAAVAAVGATIGTVTFAAAWLLNTTISANPHITGQAPRGPETLALVRQASRMAAATDLSIPTVPSYDVADVPQTFESKWVFAPAPAQAPAIEPEHPMVQARLAPTPLPKAAPAREAGVPLPQARPASAPVEVASAPVIEFVGPPAPQLVAAVAPPAAAPQQVAAVVPPPPVAPAIEKRVAPQPVHNKSVALPELDSRTAIYDISARTVYLPSGKKLEAHSGLGEKMDDPRHVNVRMRGATPPNVYQLTLREKLFHGVRAIRLNPVDEGKMFGRDGILAHTYMLGPNGQSNGCVSFKDYDAFLNAYLNGEVDRMVVVSHMGDVPPALTAKVRRGPVSRYASSEVLSPPSFTAQ